MKHFKILWVTALLIFMPCLRSMASEENIASSSEYTEKRLHVLLKAIQQQAINGDKECQCAWSTLCRDGIGVTQNYQEAVKWAWLPAKQDYWKAYETLIELLTRESFIKRTIEMAENKKEANACYYLGALYEHGIIFERSEYKSLRWYGAAAEKKHPEACRQLGKWYQRLGTRNTPKGFHYYQMGANQRDPESIMRLGWLYIEGVQGVAQHSEAKASENLALAAQLSYEAAKYNLARLYTEEEYNRRLSWAAREKNNKPQDLYHWGWIQWEGVKEKRNLKQALKWITYSARKNYVPAMRFLAACYENGIGLKLNEKEALKWYLKAAETGDKPSQYALFSMYAEGRGTEKNYTKALEWLKKLGAFESLEFAQDLIAVLPAKYLFGCWDPNLPDVHH